MTQQCATCKHAALHDQAGIGICREPGCPCDGPLSGEYAEWVVKIAKPVPPSVQECIDKIKALPEAEATKSRDYGRGYAQAVRDVLTILEGPR